MEASTSNQYPYPSHVFVPSFVSVKLDDQNTYDVWNHQMLNLLRSYDMIGFIDGQFWATEEDNTEWIRSDSLVLGWMLGSLSDKVAIKTINRLKSNYKYKPRFTAKDAWYELQCIYNPAPLIKPQENRLVNSLERDVEAHKREFYSRILEGNLELIKTKLREVNIPTYETLTFNNDTALHIAVGLYTNNNQEILNYFLERVPVYIDLCKKKNLDGSTLLHVAAIVGNTEAAKILIKKSPRLLLAEDNKGRSPLALSLSQMHFETSRYMLASIKTDNDPTQYDTLFTGPSGDDLLFLAISLKEFDFAADLLEHYQTIDGYAVLVALAQNLPSDLGFWRRLALRPFLEKRVSNYNKVSYLVKRVLELMKRTTNYRNSYYYYSKPVFEAIRQNAQEVVIDIVENFPGAITVRNEDGHDFIQYAVINRSEKIYNLLYNMGKNRNIYKTMQDSSGNNLLHLAVRLAPNNRLKLISGAALQMQRELQWLKEIEGFVSPLHTIQKNNDGETPEMVFSREHKELVIKGEEWIKKTAESYTITAALITTIVFAAAITVPGGNDQNKGTPLFTNKPAFTIFAISDAISLFTAVTSLLMFLSILTTRFSEKDFLFKLPKRLIMGLSMLFISTTAMIIAFGATLFLVFGQGNLWVLIPIGALTCLPIISFVTLQFPLIMDLISSTYGRNIFVKPKSCHPFY